MRDAPPKQSEPLDEDEQARIVDALGRERTALARPARLVFCALNVGLAAACVASLVALLRGTSSIGVPGDAPGGGSVLAHQAYLSASVPGAAVRLVAAYVATAVTACCSARVCLGSAGARARRAAAVFAMLPAAVWARWLLKLRAPLAVWGIVVFAAPLSVAISVSVDGDLRALDAGVAELDSLRYKHKAV